MTQKEKFLALVSFEDSGTFDRNKERIRNRAMLRESQQIALKVLLRLDVLGWSQRDLARELQVSPQQVSKIVSGKENLTLETQIKLQTLLEVPILATFYEQKIDRIEEMIVSFEKRMDKIETQTAVISNRYQSQSAVYHETFNFPILVA